MTGPRILITGGAGYIGSRLACRLAGKAGCAVVALDNLRRGTPGALDSAPESVRLVEVDVRDSDAIDELARGTDVIYHLAAESAVISAESNPGYCFDTNVTGTRNVLRAAKRNGVSRVVFTSSREVYGNAVSLPVSETTPLCPRNEYGASKAAAEMYCQSFAGTGPEITILRLSNVYGPGDRGRVIPAFVERALADEPLTLFGAQQLMDFLWIGTAIEALVRVGIGPYLPGPLNVASGKGVTITELAGRVIAAAISKSSIQTAPARELEVVRFVADISAARAALGLDIAGDPLFGLDEVISAARTEQSRATETYEYSGI